MHLGVTPRRSALPPSRSHVDKYDVANLEDVPRAPPIQLPTWQIENLNSAHLIEFDRVPRNIPASWRPHAAISVG